MSSSFVISQARIFGPGGTAETGALAVRDGRFTRPDDEAAGHHRYDAAGLLLLPGIVDLHGDAFERQIMPRPGVHFALDLALADTDRQLVANGITTAFHAVTWSWEPGLRSGKAARAMAEALDQMRPRLLADNRFHLRWETFALDAEPEVLDLLERGLIHLLAFNDHTPEILRRVGSPKFTQYTERTGLQADALKLLLDRVWSQRDQVPAAIERLAGAAAGAGVPLASHDDESAEMRRSYRGIGCTLAEFPKTLDATDDAVAAGDTVIMGAPNVVRGGSHSNGIGAASMVREGRCSVLTSDYYYPALLHAAFRLARDGICTLPKAWDLVSANPARAAGLADRGSLEAGKRADFILVDDSDAASPHIVATFVAGRPVYVNDRLRLAA